MAETPTTREELQRLVVDAIYEDRIVLDALSAAGLAVVPREATNAIIKAWQQPHGFHPDDPMAWTDENCANSEWRKMCAAADLLTKEE